VPGNASTSTIAPKTKAVNTGGGACFPGSATLAVRSTAGEGYSTVRMDELQIGMSVRVSASRDSEVFLFTHRLRAARAVYVTLTTGCIEEEAVRCKSYDLECNASRLANSSSCRDSSITLSAEHYIHTHPRGLLPARDLRIGDHLVKVPSFARIDGSIPPSTLARVTRAERHVSNIGLYAPHTLDGDVVVDGFLVSTYTSVLHPAVAHAVLGPLRAAYVVRGWTVHGSFDAGAPEFLVYAISLATQSVRQIASFLQSAV
jgi:Hint module